MNASKMQTSKLLFHRRNSLIFRGGGGFVYKQKSRPKGEESALVTGKPAVPGLPHPTFRSWVELPCQHLAFHLRFKHRRTTRDRRRCCGHGLQDYYARGTASGPAAWHYSCAAFVCSSIESEISLSNVSIRPSPGRRRRKLHGFNSEPWITEDFFPALTLSGHVAPSAL